MSPVWLFLISSAAQGICYALGIWAFYRLGHRRGVEFAMREYERLAKEILSRRDEFVDRRGK